MCSVDLRIQAVEQMDVVSGRMQGGGRVCSNKTGTAGNQDVHNAHRDGGQRNLALKKSYHAERVRVFIMGCFFLLLFYYLMSVGEERGCKGLFLRNSSSFHANEACLSGFEVNYCRVTQFPVG